MDDLMSVRQDAFDIQCTYLTLLLSGLHSYACARMCTYWGRWCAYRSINGGNDDVVDHRSSIVDRRSCCREGGERCIRTAGARSVLPKSQAKWFINKLSTSISMRPTSIPSSKASCNSAVSRTLPTTREVFLVFLDIRMAMSGRLIRKHQLGEGAGIRELGWKEVQILLQCASMTTSEILCFS